MGLVITITLGFCLWIVLWAIGWKGDDAGLLALAIILIVVAVKIAASHLTPNRPKN
jgi:hypothetical protein